MRRCLRTAGKTVDLVIVGLVAGALLTQGPSATSGPRSGASKVSWTEVAPRDLVAKELMTCCGLQRMTPVC